MAFVRLTRQSPGVAELRAACAKFRSDGIWLASWGSFGSGTGQFDMPIDVATELSSLVPRMQERPRR